MPTTDKAHRQVLTCPACGSETCAGFWSAGDGDRVRWWCRSVGAKDEPTTLLQPRLVDLDAEPVIVNPL